MAKKQTRRTVSISRPVFDAARDLAASRGVTLAYLCELGLRSVGVDAPIGVHQTPEQAATAMRRRSPVTTGSQVVKRVAGLAESGGLDGMRERAGTQRPKIKVRVRPVFEKIEKGAPVTIEWRDVKIVQSLQRLPGPIRRALGDDIANMCGEPLRPGVPA